MAVKEHTEGSPSAARASGGAQAGGTDVQTLAGADAGGHRPLRDETVAEFESAAQVGAQLNKMEGKAATTGDVEACGGMRGSSSAPSDYRSCAGAVAAPASIGAETGADFLRGPQICVFHHNIIMENDATPTSGELFAEAEEEPPRVFDERSPELSQNQSTAGRVAWKKAHKKGGFKPGGVKRLKKFSKGDGFRKKKF